jgi:hypothetical protein
MSYENILEAQAKRDAKEIVFVKRKRGLKRENSAPVVTKPKKKRKNKVEIAEDEKKALGLGIYCSVLQL